LVAEGDPVSSHPCSEQLALEIRPVPVRPMWCSPSRFATSASQATVACHSRSPVPGSTTHPYYLKPGTGECSYADPVPRRATLNHRPSMVIGSVIPSALGPCWTESISFRPFPAGIPAFFVRGSPPSSRHRLPADPWAALVLLAHVVLLGTQRALHAALAVLNPALDLRRGQVELAAGGWQLAAGSWQLAAATVVLPGMISRPCADLRRAVQRLIFYSITSLNGVSVG
jgi:hypothetical protein